MFIVHVTPIAKGGLEQLSYFSPQDFTVGSVIHVPLRKKEIPALVHKVEDARAIKALLKTNLYETRKIRKQKELHVFSSEFVRAAHTTAEYYATSVGIVIQSYVPAAILKDAEEGNATKRKTNNNVGTGFEKLMLQLSRKDRIEKYKTIIRSNFAQDGSLFLCVPTVREARVLYEEYSKGIEKYAFLLESSQSPKKQKETWDAILDETHPVLIIATPVFASIPRDDISMFILENEMSSAYKQQARPRADARILIEYLAQEMRSALVYAGTTVSLKVHKEMESGFVRELEEHTLKLRTSSKTHIIDAKAARTFAKEKKKEFPILTNESIDALKECNSRKEHSFVFAARRGIASHTVCNDCNTTVTCMHCKSPVVLHKRGESRELLCHRCGTSRDAHETCMQCNSWDLVPLGIGIERIEEYIRLHIPEAPLFVLNSDTAKTPAKAKKITDSFYETEGAILIGTEMTLPYITQEVSCSIMSSIDSLLCIPDFRIEERIFAIITTLKERSQKHVYIETSSPNNAMLKHAKTGSLSEYARDELILRKKMHYPPYTHLIKVTFNGTRALVIGNMQKFIELTQEYKPRVFAGFIPRGPNLELHALIRTKTSSWPDTKLTSILKALPSTGSVDVDPERTL
ncbi:hypothetical protein JXR01_00535 [Candidatus Kaiserbacteria bacterium]|nr:MAG: hypothetical protein JXR01_00535 [Candidatus Kaiserbacteria bacterium]